MRRSTAERTQKHLQELHNDIKRTLHDLAKSYPNDPKSKAVLHDHKVRISVHLDQQQPIKLRRRPGQQWEEPYPLTPVPTRDIVLIVVLILSIGGGMWGVYWVLSLFGVVSGY
jgi:hypothetical protein